MEIRISWRPPNWTATNAATEGECPASGADCLTRSQDVAKSKQFNHRDFSLPFISRPSSLNQGTVT